MLLASHAAPSGDQQPLQYIMPANIQERLCNRRRFAVGERVQIIFICVGMYRLMEARNVKVLMYMRGIGASFLCGCARHTTFEQEVYICHFSSLLE